MEIAKPLKIVQSLFESTSKNALSCCHFKSNQHLDAALSGETDIDLFIPLSHKEQFRSLIVATDSFKEFKTIGSGKYDDVEDYLGFDSETARLTHLHVHYRLVIGEKFFKSYIVPWDHDFQNACESKIQGLTIPTPEVELCLLLTRLALKLRWRDLLIPGLARRLFGKAERDEYYWLVKRVDHQVFREVCNRFTSPRTAQNLETFLDAQPSVRSLLKLRNLLKDDLKQYRIAPWHIAQTKRIVRECIWFLGAINKRYLNLPIAFRRTLANEGKFIAFIGPDGAGKSTLVNNIGKWLVWKLDVHYVYFGSGDGPSSFFRWPLSLTLRTIKLFRRRKMPSSSGSTAFKRLTPERIVWALTLALEKRYKFWKAKIAKRQGCIVIFDRFPQTDVVGFNDGPLLTNWLDQTGIRASLAHWEYNIYKTIQQIGPDLTLRLQVDPKTAVARKADMNINEIERRILAVNTIRFSQSHVVDINCDAPLSEVIKEVRKRIWDSF